MKLLHRRSEEMHPFEQAQVDQHRENDLYRVRMNALVESRYHFHDRHEDPTPEQILSVAAKFEAYLTAPTSVLTEGS
jgi:hypothetical protein